MDRTTSLFVVVSLGLVASACGSQSAAGPDPQAANSPTAGAGGSAPQIDRSKCDDKGKQVVTADTNQDKKPDVFKFYAPVQQGGQTVQVLTCKQVDLNHDGKIDIVYYYEADGTQPSMEEFDLDFDGRFDETIYYQGGKKVREEMDTNYDKRPDVWKYFEDDKLVRIERDTNDDSKVDEWQYYEGGKLDRIGYDTTGSGRVDKWDRSPEGADDTAGENAGARPAAAAAAAAAPAGGAQTAPPPVAAPAKR